MPLTRTRSQATIDFPAKKGLRSTRSKVKLLDENSPVSSPRKRAIIKEHEASINKSPAKRRREKSLSDDKENASAPSPINSPVRPSTPKRLPLSPRKDVNIMAPNCRNSPAKFGLVQSPFKENPKTPILSPINSPRRIRALEFNSPAKENCLTPVDRNLPGVSKCRALSFDSPSKWAVVKSPRKSVGTPRPNVKPVVSPLRLARQEGVCYQRAKQALHTAIPDRIVCREGELATVDRFLAGHLYKGVPGSLYISGAPGTGKTAVLTHTMNKLRADKQKLVYINCMSLRNSQAIYNAILSEVKGQDTSLSVKHAQAELEKQLTAKGNMVVLVLDEMDQLDSKNQEILYTMFEWPSLDRSRLVLIGIANALDLTDRILPRLQARPNCKPELLNFTPYSRDQIVQVLQERLKQVEVDGQTILEPSALRFCACKVAAVAGDMRKALDVCRRAVEMVEAEVRKQRVLANNSCNSPTKRPFVPKKIGVPHILKIVNEVYGSRMSAQAAKPQTIPLQQKLAICSLLLMLKQKKTKEVVAGKLHETYSKVCKKQNVPPVDQSEFLSMCQLIEARGIMSSKKTKDARSTKITLKLDEKEVEAALQDKTLISSVLNKGL